MKLPLNLKNPAAIIDANHSNSNKQSERRLMAYDRIGNLKGSTPDDTKLRALILAVLKMKATDLAVGAGNWQSGGSSWKKIPHCQCWGQFRHPPRHPGQPAVWNT